MWDRVAQAGRLDGNPPAFVPSLAVEDALTIGQREGSSDDFQAVLLHEMQQFERGPGRALLTDFPLLHC
jgi:hypothetical protein